MGEGGKPRESVGYSYAIMECMRRSSNLPKDVNQRAAEIVRLSIESDKQPLEQALVSQYLTEIGRKGGLKGGKARAAKLSPRKRKQIARKAAKSRWKRKP